MWLHMKTRDIAGCRIEKNHRIDWSKNYRRCIIKGFSGRTEIAISGCTEIFGITEELLIS